MTSDFLEPSDWWVYVQRSGRDLELGFGSDGFPEGRREEAVVGNGKEVAASHLDGRKICEQHPEEEVGHAL